MNIKFSIEYLSEQLNHDKVIAYPTESVFGLGCNPDSKNAVYTLLSIKRRSWKKGLILVAANYNQLLKYIDDRYLSYEQKLKIFSSWPGHTTWVFPARISTPYWLTGQFSSIAVRVSHFRLIQRLCLSFGKPLVSTSANVSGYPPVKIAQDLFKQLGYNKNYLIMPERVLGLVKTSEIRDASTGFIIRK